MSRQCLSETLSTCERHYPLQHQHQLHHHHQLHQQSQYNHVHNQHQQQSLYGAESDGSSGFLLSGYHKKLKTMKKKYFVLYRDSMDNVARLEYYDNDKKFKSGFDAKRVIKLKNCFNISRRMDTKYEFVIALATKDGGFGIVIESENEMNKWLNNLLSLQRKYCGEFDLPLFDCVWQVVIQRKGLAEQKGLIGNYHVCLTNKSITFLKITSGRSMVVGSMNSQRLQRVDVLLTTVRRCGDSQCYFYMEIGRQSTIGPGELWMETEDALIAKNMHRMILSKMTSINETSSSAPTSTATAAATQVDPMRKRSSSATEATKPLNDMQRKIVQPLNTNLIRKRCDSLPSRNCLTNADNSSTAVSTATVAVATPATIVTTSMAAVTATNETVSTATPIVSAQHHQQRSNGSSTGALGNSESEESSISFEESEDPVAYSLYRLGTQNTTDGIIPEEGSDEPCNAEKTLTDPNHFMNTDNLKYCAAGIQQTATNHLKSGSLGGKYSLTNSNKYILDKHSKDFASEHGLGANDAADMCSVRPVRAYSVGNRIQHNNLHVIKEKGNDSGGNLVGRVRAFSVGSKTKTETKLETRATTSPRAMMANYNNNLHHNHHSYNNFINSQNCNNNNNSNSGLYCIMDGSGKKSTSVPLLSSKRYHASAEQMSDLMEIDFSKSTRKYTNSQMMIVGNRQNDLMLPRSALMVPPANNAALSSLVRDQSPEMLHKSLESLSMVDGTSSLVTAWSQAYSSSPSAAAAADNGYLEMRPISANTAAEASQRIENRDFVSLPAISRLNPENQHHHFAGEKESMMLSKGMRGKESSQREPASSLMACKGDRSQRIHTQFDDCEEVVDMRKDEVESMEKEGKESIIITCSRSGNGKESSKSHSDVGVYVPAASYLKENDNSNEKEKEEEGELNWYSDPPTPCSKELETISIKQPQNLNQTTRTYFNNCSVNEHISAPNSLLLPAVVAAVSSSASPSPSPTRIPTPHSLVGRKLDSPSSPTVDKLVTLNTVNNLSNTLYYASLDLPVCSKEYNAKSEHFYDKTLVNNIKNVYAKIDFEHPEALSFTRQNS